MIQKSSLFIFATLLTPWVHAHEHAFTYPHIPEKSYGVFVTADALIWKMQQSGREFARTVNANANPSYILGIVALQPCLTYQPGFRLGLGYTFPCHQLWDVYAYYTQFNASQSNAAVPTSDKIPVMTATIHPTWPEKPVDRAAACFNGHFKNFDIEMGKKFVIADNLRLRYHLGVRWAQIKERYTITYTGGSTLTTAAASPLVIFQKNNFSGAGIQTGINSEIDMFKDHCWCPEISFYGDASFALLSGKTCAYGDETHNTTLFANGYGKYGITKAAFDLALGLRWNKMFCNDRINLRIQLGWEQHYYPNIWIWVPAINTAGNGDFAVSGVVVGARIDF